MRTIVRWCNWSGEGLDYCSLVEGDKSSVIEGLVIGTPAENYAAHYTVRTDRAFRTRGVRVDFVGGPRLHLAADGEGNWRDLIRDEPVPLLTGCLDVDIAITPATNTLAIKRLKLKQQESREIAVAYVPEPAAGTDDFSVQRMTQRYTCLIADHRYRYEGALQRVTGQGIIDHGFTAELQIDEYGLVLDYPEIFRRIQS
ncbi:putative glycolipid-binding domain-containing protein [Pseudomonas sp. R1-18]|uniref:putative glycolipid-binding domain-containing protein n=1 Tax=Pseudomonas sp. R1-18 TaxID=1632772 RepID=UPI003DA9EC7F